MAIRRVMIDHVTIGVSDLQRSRAFYEQALAPLGFDQISTSDVMPGEIEFGGLRRVRARPRRAQRRGRVPRVRAARRPT
jgi:catechol 2,3-dioxygenase-like lactoylglutathione lyase family enzyme